MTKTGNGLLILTGSNSTYGGGTTLSAGTLQLGDGTANNGAVPGGITNNATLVFANPLAQTFTGAIGGSGAVGINGTGTLTLTATSFYSGGTSISAATALLNGALTGSGTVNVNSSATLAGTGSVSGTVVANSGGHINPAGVGATGTLTLGSLTAQPGSIFDFDMGPASACDNIMITRASGLNLSGTGTVNIVSWSSGFGLGTYPLIFYNGTLAGSVTNLSLGITPTGYAYSLSDSTGSSINLIVSPLGPATWANNQSGLWSDGNNWGGSPVPNAAGAQAVLGGVASSAVNVTLDASVTLGQLTISPTGAASYTVTGNATNMLTMTDTGGAASINVLGGGNTIGAAVAFTNSAVITVGDTTSVTSGTTTLTISGAFSGTGSLTKQGLGLLALGSSLSLSSGGLLVNAGTMTTALSIVGTDGTITVGVDSQNTAVLKARSLKVQKLVLSPGSKIVLGTAWAPRQRPKRGRALPRQPRTPRAAASWVRPQRPPARRPPCPSRERAPWRAWASSC